MALRKPDTTTRGDGGPDDWAVTATDTIVRVVDGVRAKTTGPAITASRALVYGLLALLLGVAALVLGAIGTVRSIDVYLPDSVFGERHTWAAHVLVGSVFSVVGLALWSKRHASARR